MGRDRKGVGAWEEEKERRYLKDLLLDVIICVLSWSGAFALPLSYLKDWWVLLSIYVFLGK